MADLAARSREAQRLTQVAEPVVLLAGLDESSFRVLPFVERPAHLLLLQVSSSADVAVRGPRSGRRRMRAFASLVLTRARRLSWASGDSAKTFCAACTAQELTRLRWWVQLG